MTCAMSRVYDESMRLFVFTVVDGIVIHQCFMFDSSLPPVASRRAHVCLIYVFVRVQLSPTRITYMKNMTVVL